jgi:hypothetical protein
VQVPSHGIASGPQAVTRDVSPEHCPPAHEPELHTFPQLPQFWGSVMTEVMMPLQGTGWSEEAGAGGLLPKSEAKKVLRGEKKSPPGPGAVVFPVMPGAGPSAGPCETGTGAPSDACPVTSGGALSEGGRDVITGNVPSAGTGLTLVAKATRPGSVVTTGRALPARMGAEETGIGVVVTTSPVVKSSCGAVAGVVFAGDTVTGGFAVTGNGMVVVFVTVLS